MRPGLDVMLAGTPWLDERIPMSMKGLAGPLQASGRLRRLAADAILLLPVVRNIVMQHESVAIAKFDLVPRGSIGVRVALHVGGRDRLHVSAGEHRMWDEFWGVHHFKPYSSTLR